MSTDAPEWSAPADPGTAGVLARWCATVGPIFYRAQPATAAAPTDRLALISWNIHEGSGDVDELVRRLRRGEFSGGQAIDQFVLLLQEVTRLDSTVPRHILSDAPSPHRIAPPAGRPNADVHRFAGDGYAVLYAPSMRNGESQSLAEDRGNAIVSTLPLERPRLIELPLQHQRRVAVMASVAGHDRRGTPWHLNLVDVHLDTTLGLLHGGPMAERRRQAMAVVDAVRASLPTSADRSLTVVAGDLNSWLGVHDEAVRALREEFTGTMAVDRRPTWIGPLGLRATLDHIFIRGASAPVRVTRLSSRFGSDHFPLLIVLDF